MSVLLNMKIEFLNFKERVTSVINFNLAADWQYNKTRNYTNKKWFGSELDL